MTCYSIEARVRKYVKGYGFYSFVRNLSDKYGEKVLDTATKTGLDAAKTASKKAGEVTGELIGNKIAKTNCETKTCA